MSPSKPTPDVERAYQRLLDETARMQLDDEGGMGDLARVLRAAPLLSRADAARLQMAVVAVVRVETVMKDPNARWTSALGARNAAASVINILREKAENSQRRPT